MRKKNAIDQTGRRTRASASQTTAKEEDPVPGTTNKADVESLGGNRLPDGSVGLITRPGSTCRLSRNFAERRLRTRFGELEFAAMGSAYFLAKFRAKRQSASRTGMLIAIVIRQTRVAVSRVPRLPRSARLAINRRVCRQDDAKIRVNVAICDPPGHRVVG